MKITLQLPSDLEQNLINAANRDRLTPEMLILQTLRQCFPVAEPVKTWPQVVLDYVGDPDFPAFEADRDLLLPPDEPELF